MSKIVHVALCQGAGRSGLGFVLSLATGTGVLALIWWACVAMGRGWMLGIASVALAGVGSLIWILVTAARDDYQAVKARDPRPAPRIELGATSHVVLDDDTAVIPIAIPAQRTELPDNVVAFRQRESA